MFFLIYFIIIDKWEPVEGFNPKRGTGATEAAGPIKGGLVNGGKFSADTRKLRAKPLRVVDVGSS